MPKNADYHLTLISQSQHTFLSQPTQIEPENTITTQLSRYLTAVFDANYGLKDKRRHAVVDFINQIGEFSAINSRGKETRYLKALQHSSTPTRSESPTTITEIEHLDPTTVIRPSSPIGVEQTSILNDVCVTYGDAQKKQAFQKQDIPTKQFKIKSVFNDFFNDMLRLNIDDQDIWAVDQALCELTKKLKRFHRTYFPVRQTSSQAVVEITFQRAHNSILNLQQRLRFQKKRFCLFKVEYLQDIIKQLEKQPLYSLSDLYILHAKPHAFNGVKSMNVLRSRAEDLHNQLTSYNSTPSAQTLNELQDQINDLQTEIGLLRQYEDKLRKNKQQFEYDYKQQLTTIASLKDELRYKMRSISCTTEYQELDGIIQRAQGGFLRSMQYCIDRPSERQVFSMNQLQSSLQISINKLAKKNKVLAFWQRLECCNAHYHQLQNSLNFFDINDPSFNRLEETYESIKRKIKHCYTLSWPAAQTQARLNRNTQISPAYQQVLIEVRQIETEIESYKQAIIQRQRQFRTQCDLHKTLLRVKESFKQYQQVGFYVLPHQGGRPLGELYSSFQKLDRKILTYKSDMDQNPDKPIDIFFEELIEKMTATGEQYQDVIKRACWLKHYPRKENNLTITSTIGRNENVQNKQDTQLRMQINKLKKECAILQAINKDNSQEHHPKSLKIFHDNLSAKIIENAKIVLSNYQCVRDTGYSIGFFSGLNVRGTAFKKANKIESARKLLLLLKKLPTTLEPDHIKALQDKRLGEITSALESAGILSLKQNQLSAQACRLPSIG